MSSVDKHIKYLHDLSNKLSLVSLSLCQLEDHKELLPEVEEVSNRLSTTSELVRELRSHFVHEKAKTKGQITELSELLNKLKENTASYLTLYGISEILFKCELDESATQVYVQRKLLQKAIEQILDNGKKGGATKFFLRIKEQKNLVEINISDNGSGLSEEAIEAMSWESEDSDMKIQSIRNCIQEAGGTVKWKSIENIGTCVIIYLQKKK